MPEPQQMEKKRRKEWGRQGLLLDDRQVLDAMEPGQKQRLPVKENKDGALTGDLADRGQLRQLEKYVFRVLGKLVEDIVSGNVEPNPYTRGSDHDTCRFCPYGDVCHSGSVTGRRNYKKIEAQEFWEQIEKELRQHG